MSQMLVWTRFLRGFCTSLTQTLLFRKRKTRNKHFIMLIVVNVDIISDKRLKNLKKAMTNIQVLHISWSSLFYIPCFLNLLYTCSLFQNEKLPNKINFETNCTSKILMTKKRVEMKVNVHSRFDPNIVSYCSDLV